jgi:hypothetical protein
VLTADSGGGGHPGGHAGARPSRACGAKYRTISALPCGFITRTPNPADRRAALVTITEAGARAVDDLFPRQLAAEVDLLVGLGEDQEWVRKALGRLVEVMQTGGGHD